MNRDNSYSKNDAAFKRMKLELDNRYPTGHFVALHEGNLVADGATYQQLTAALQTAGLDRPDVFVAQAGIEYPEYGVILSANSDCSREDNAAKSI